MHTLAYMPRDSGIVAQDVNLPSEGPFRLVPRPLPICLLGHVARDKDDAELDKLIKLLN